jgi:hypothetical protein
LAAFTTISCFSQWETTLKSTMATHSPRKDESSLRIVEGEAVAVDDVESLTPGGVQPPARGRRTCFDQGRTPSSRDLVGRVGKSKVLKALEGMRCA